MDTPITTTSITSLHEVRFAEVIGHIEAAVKEAKAIAKANDVAVMFYFNNTLVVVGPHTSIKDVLEIWDYRRRVDQTVTAMSRNGNRDRLA